MMDATTTFSVPTIPDVTFTMVVQELSIHVCPEGVVCQKMPEYFATVHLMRKEKDGRVNMVGATVIDNRRPDISFDLTLFEKLDVTSRLNMRTKKIDVDVFARRQ